MLQIGSLIDNKYKILSEVGHGGMSVVYLAINERANKTWAVKEIRKDGVCDFEAVKQGLVVETDMLKRLNHPHLPSIIDVIDAEDSFLIVMDYIEGKSLQSVIKKGGAQPQDLVIKWAIQLCDVLGYLHTQDPPIIYRDMKPANVMLKPSGDITLIDFGTAREFKNRAMVEDTTCLGTRGYAAPEQFGGRGQTDPRTDIYCLGATLYHLITGHSPAEPPYEIKPLSYWDPSFYGSGLELIINKCCQQDPAARYQDCSELMYDLEHVNDIDLGTQRKRKQKWAAFVASVAVFAVGVAGMVGFSLAKNAAKEESYEYYIQLAEQTESNAEYFDEFMEHIDGAMKVDPTQYEAYNLLLSWIESDMNLDTGTEWVVLQQSLAKRQKDSGPTYIDELLDADQENYAEVQFRIGKLLFLMSDGSSAKLHQASIYFRRALEEGKLANYDQSKANLATTLYTIGDNINQLENPNNLLLEQDYTYGDLWNSMSGLISDYEIADLGRYVYGISMYGRVASMTLSHYKGFLSEGVTIEQMEALLDTIGERLETTESALMERYGKNSKTFDNYAEYLEKAKSNVSTARKELAAAQNDKGED